MSDENIELVRRLQPTPDVELTDFFRRDDDAGAEELIAAFSSQFTPDFACVFHTLSSDERQGVVGLREAWLDWLEPWETYRTEIERVRDGGGDRVLVVSRDFGRRPGMDAEVEMKGTAVWTVRDGKIARTEFFTNPAQAMEAAGLGE